MRCEAGIRDRQPYNDSVIEIRSTTRRGEPIPWEPASPGGIGSWHLDGSGEGAWGRWSYRAVFPKYLVRCDSRTLVTQLFDSFGVIKEWPDPLQALAWMAEQLKEPPTPGPPFKGGWLGYLSYDLGRLFERLPVWARDDLEFPLFEFTYHDFITAHDASEGSTVWVDHGHSIAPWSTAGRNVPIHFGQFTPAPAHLCGSFSRPAYEMAVAKAIDYIRAGDVFQVNLSQRFTAALPAHPADIYKRLHREHPGWFGAYLPYDERALICNSPELFLRVTPDPVTGKRRVITRPIKGTRPRLPGMEAELRDSAKDQAELHMIVDLERNDLGRVCEIGSVRVTQPRAIEAHPTVYHGVATVEGVLRDDVTFVDLLRATFPGGSVTGAPKIRAMEIIEELEPVRRGPYCGAIGYLSADGHVEFNVAIRTMIVKDGLVHVPVGGGVVADSDPAAEYEETLVKARAMFAALGVSAADVR